MSPAIAFEDLEHNSPQPPPCPSIPSFSWSIKTIRDNRWHGIDPLPITVALFFLSLLLIALTGAELSLGFAILPLIILLISIATTIHTALDLVLYMNGHLPPIYTLCITVIMLISWIIGVGLGAADVARGNVRGPPGVMYGHCLKGYDEGSYKRLGCFVPRARLVDEVVVMMFYVVFVAMSSVAYRRHRDYVFRKIYAQRCMCGHVNASLARQSATMQSRRNSLAVVPEGGVATEVSALPPVPERSASRLSRGSIFCAESEKIVDGGGGDGGTLEGMKYI